MADIEPRLPLEALFSPGGVGPAALRVVGRDLLVNDVYALGERVALLLLNLLDNILLVSSYAPRFTYPNGLGELQNGELVAVTDVDRPSVVAVHEKDEAVDEIVDVLERPRLRTVAVNRHILTLERLDNEVGDDTAIVGIHARTKGVEDTGDTDIDAILTHIAVREGLGDTLALVVACTRTDAVDMTPVVLPLRVLLRVPVNLRGRGDEETSLGALGETKHVQSTHEGGLDRLDRVVLVVGRRSGTCEVVDFCL